MRTNELVVDKSRDWVQVIHVANRAHWVCVHKRSDDDYVRLYDSLKSTKISEHIGEQVASIQGTDTVLFKHENVAQQKGAEDCGLFALAFATSICFNENTSVQFVFFVSKRISNVFLLISNLFIFKSYLF